MFTANRSVNMAPLRNTHTFVYDIFVDGVCEGICIFSPYMLHYVYHWKQLLSEDWAYLDYYSNMAGARPFDTPCPQVSTYASSRNVCLALNGAYRLVFIWEWVEYEKLRYIFFKNLILTFFGGLTYNIFEDIIISVDKFSVKLHSFLFSQFIILKYIFYHYNLFALIFALLVPLLG